MAFVGLLRFTSEILVVDILTVISVSLACFIHRTQDSVVVDPLTLLAKGPFDGRSRGG